MSKPIGTDASPPLLDLSTLPRRHLLALGGVAFLERFLSACSSAPSSTGSTSGTSTATDAGAAAAAADAAVADAGAWATGGTAAMTGKASYPNPFTTAPTTCAVTCELTQGPCYSSQSVEIQDISYGYDGLPMRMMLQVLDESCKPVVGAVVDVWHVGPTGKYSGDDATNENVAFCTGNDSDFTSHLYFRGKQTTDASGVVTFDTCFPGWYSSRTVHVHMTISVGSQAYLTTQLGFDDTLDDEIIATQPLYDARGKRDTTNTTDTVLPATGVSDYLFQTQRMSDGAMLAYKTLILRSALSETICSPTGSGGPPGGGGP
jgi:protocatechuate 3,4-dioxygenase beta subunit